MAQWNQPLLGRTGFIPGLHSGLKIWVLLQLWLRLKLWLGSDPWPGNSICHRTIPPQKKKRKKKKKRKEKKERIWVDRTSFKKPVKGTQIISQKVSDGYAEKSLALVTSCLLLGESGNGRNENSQPISSGLYGKRLIGLSPYFPCHSFRD